MKTLIGLLLISLVFIAIAAEPENPVKPVVKLDKPAEGTDPSGSDGDKIAKPGESIARTTNGVFGFYKGEGKDTIPDWAWFIAGCIFVFLTISFVFYFLKRKFLDKSSRIKNDRFASAEFWLVIFMLITLTALVVLVMVIPPFDVPFADTRPPTPAPAPEKTSFENLVAQTVLYYSGIPNSQEKIDALPIEDPTTKESQNIQMQTITLMADSRKTILTIIITAFGAWVGAGAAYFFGRENMKAATESLKEVTLGTKIRQLRIKDLNPSSIVDLVVQTSTPLSEAIRVLTKEPKRWFLPVINESRKFCTLIHEEIVWRFMNSNSLKLDTNDFEEKAKEYTIQDLITYRDQNLETRVFSTIFIIADMDDLVTDIFSQTSPDVYVVIVLDENNYPLFSLTEGQLSRALMRMN